MKKCPKCNESKELDKFYQDNGGIRTHSSWCKKCLNDRKRAEYKKNHEIELARVRKDSYKRLYNITIEDYDRMFVSQMGRCEICQEKPGNGKRLVVDHNHKTGKVRRLLCSRCNALIGMCKERVDILLNSIKYLESNT